ncbi:response regulator [Chloroflexota bacterium]
MAEKILIVEDNSQNMRVIQMALRRLGYTFLEASDGEAGMAAAIQEKPDLIIMDVQLPKMDGLEITRRLREMPEFSQVPIIAITAYAMKGDMERALAVGCDAYLTKPINTRELPKVIVELLANRQNNPRQQRE